MKMSSHPLYDVLITSDEYPQDFQPQFINENLINCTFLYIKDYVRPNIRDLVNEILRERLEQIYLDYMLRTLRSDLFIEVTRNTNSKEAREVKRDLKKALKCIEDIRIILHGRYAGNEINKFLMQETHKHRIGSELGDLEYACQEALRHYSPEKGRNPSKEREARIDMIASLISLFEGMEVPTPSQQESSFELFIKEIYEMLKIYVEHPHQDIKKAKKQLFENNIQINN